MAAGPHYIQEVNQVKDQGAAKTEVLFSLQYNTASTHNTQCIFYDI